MIDYNYIERKIYWSRLLLLLLSLIISITLFSIGIIFSYPMSNEIFSIGLLTLTISAAIYVMFKKQIDTSLQYIIEERSLYNYHPLTYHNTTI